jgi:2-oxoglutarate ferredoxin oxidoreductase subunit beta
MHSIHGRATAIASGLKATRPELSVWVVTGDGDGLSIGGNHMAHLLRRNFDLNVLLFNNEIYGLTKGQYSPTSRVGTTSPSSPGGSVDSPISPGQFALGAGAKFYARGVDTDKTGMSDVLKQAHAFQGTSLIEIFQNCIVYNVDVFASFTDRKNAANTQLHLKHGEPMLFGENNGNGIRLNRDTLALEVVDASESPDDVLVHDEANKTIARLLIDLHIPVAMGVIYRQPSISYEDAFYAHHPSRMKRTKSISDFIKGPSSWTVD